MKDRLHAVKYAYPRGGAVERVERTEVPTGGKVESILAAATRTFLDLVLSPDAIAVHRIIVAEVTRFPALGEVFWRAGPERTLGQIETFMRRAAAAGSLEIAQPHIAAEQFVGLMRGENHLRHLL